MFFSKTIILFILIWMTPSYAWPPSNYSKSSATYGIGALDDEVDWSRHPCKRECKDNEAPMTCRYGFTAENYVTMSKACYNCPFNVTDCYRLHCAPGDGNMVVILVINRRLPGPSIEVCKNDRIIVDLSNNLNGEAMTIHWHGQHQRGTPFMDGVPMVSQCPIAAGDSFRYEFVADNAGTHWWHAHSGFQRTQGIFGAFIVRVPPSQNLLAGVYDHDEHVIVLNEWSDHPIPETFWYLYMGGVSLMRAHTILINGFGRYKSDHNNKSSLIPRPVFRVKKDTKHRFRLINAGGYTCTFTITVDRHTLLVVSTDGSDVKPLEVDAIRSVPGERYDFVIDANREVGNYWIHISGTENCAFRHQEAILRYEGAAEVEPVEPVGHNIGVGPGKRLLNPAQRASETHGAMCISCVLTSLKPDDGRLARASPDHRFYISIDSYVINNEYAYRENLYDTSQVRVSSFSMQLNHLTFKSPNAPLQTQPEVIRANQLCNVTEARCTRVACKCSHIHEIKLNSIVELIFVAEATITKYISIEPSHGMHLHGFYFNVVAMEKLNRTTSIEQVRELDRAGKIHRKFKGAPSKDVLDVPSGGYAIVRFRADNPGFWFFHCHYDTHSHSGMAMAFKIGEYKDFPAVPKAFPKCHYHARDK